MVTGFADIVFQIVAVKANCPFCASYLVFSIILKTIIYPNSIWVLNFFNFNKTDKFDNKPK